MPPKRRRYHGLYFHSSPPKILPMNGNSFAGRQRDEVNDGFVVKPSNIRIWIHDKDIGKLTRVLWAGQGNRLRAEASTNPRVRRFLENVPYFMNVIKSVHQSVIENDLEMLQNKLDDPPPALVTTKDANGLSVMHKAAGLGHTKIVEYLIRIWPNSVTTIDATGKTPLHWAASAKDNIRIYNLLVQAGSYEDTMDYRMKVPQYYRMKPQEIDKSFLYVVPDAPRIPQYSQPDWSTLVDDIGRLEGSVPKFYYPESRRNSEVAGNNVNLLTTDSTINSIDNISEPDYFNREDSPNNDNASTVDIQSKETDIELSNGHIPNGNITPPTTTSPTPTEPIDSNQVNDSPKNIDDIDELNGNIDENLAQSEEIVSENDKSNDNDDNTNDDNKLNTNDINDNEDVLVTEDQTNDGINNNEDVLVIDNEDALVTEEQKNDGINNNEDVLVIDNEDALVTEDENNDEINNNEEALVIEDEKPDGINKEATDKLETYKINNKKETEEEEDKHEKQNDKLNVEGTVEYPNEANDDNSNNEIEKDEIKNEDLMKESDEKSNQSKIIEIVEDKHIEKEAIEGLEAVENEKNKLLSDQKISNDNEFNQNDLNDVKIENHINKDEHNKEDGQNEDDDDDQNLKNIKDIDEYHNKSVSGSPSPPLEIEGLIQGEADDNQVQSQSAEIDDETKFKTIIETGDMEQLALIVLNGEGNKLIDTKSNQPEIQAFLDNVPAYMNKIRRVHKAARDGNLRDLQSALDRRKFAIAKDEISPNGATPLHVATVFGHAGIVRYLAGRFPETTSAVDENGRTALHYAATINDNGHFYNLLSHFGANSKSTDKLGNIPDFYKNQDQSKEILGHKQLLQNFGANESLEEEMLNDQVNEFNLEIPIFKTEQGRYLATSKWLDFLKVKQPINLNSALGDPLIQALTEIAENRPSDPVLYLTEFLQKYIENRDQKSNNNNMARISNTRDIESIENGLNSLDIDNEIDNITQYQQPKLSKSVTQEPNEQDNSGDNESTSTSPSTEDRDEHGQSMLHFACARTHARNALFNLIGESNIDITYRDELYRTARDVALQAGQPGNAKEIDRYVISLAALGDIKPFEYFVITGYDHILDVTDASGTIYDVARSRGHVDLHNYLGKIREFEETREELHQAVRDENFEKIQELTAMANGSLLVKAKNYFGRTALHIGILKENEEIVEYFVNISPDALKIGDNLARMPLHYAMGITAVEIISRILIRKGAQRTAKDLKGRQPSYYFMNKADILRLQEEEDIE